MKPTHQTNLLSNVICHKCKIEIADGKSFAKVMPNRADKFDPDKAVDICYQCCGIEDAQRMLETGKATLYLTMDIMSQSDGLAMEHKTLIQEGWRSFAKPRRYGSNYRSFYARNVQVSNWPGTLAIKVYSMHIGRHNMAECQYRVYFEVYNPKTKVVEKWAGVQYGENTQICHCKRTKQFDPTLKVNLVPLGSGQVLVMTTDGREIVSSYKELGISGNSDRVQFENQWYWIVWDAQPAGVYGKTADPNSPYYVKKETAE